MSRQPRLDIPCVPQHIVQRGNNRAPCFLISGDVHLLATAEQQGGISRMMQCLGRRYVSYINRRHERTGTLWEGRYKSCLVDCDHYLWNCYRYIELNPVRAGLVGKPEDYGWSSYHGNALQRVDPLLTPHPQYIALGSDQTGRRRAYRALFLSRSLGHEDLIEIRSYLQQQRAWGDEAFQAAAASSSGRCALVRPAHRPSRRGELAQTAGLENA